MVTKLVDIDAVVEIARRVAAGEITHEEAAAILDDIAYDDGKGE